MTRALIPLLLFAALLLGNALIAGGAAVWTGQIEIGGSR